MKAPYEIEDDGRHPDDREQVEWHRQFNDRLRAQFPGFTLEQIVRGLLIPACKGEEP